MSKFISKKYEGIEGYVLGEQPKDRKYIKLNANESPYPPSPKVLASVTKEKMLSQKLYADPHNSELTQAIAECYHVNTDEIFTDGGSDVILGYLINLFNDNDHPVCFPDVTYNFYKVCAKTFGIPYEEIPLKGDYTVNVEDYISCGKNIILANPNAPTGFVLPPDVIERIVSSNPNNLVVIDEAYVDYGNQTCIPLIHKYNNLLVVHTTSKSRNLAGARVGYAISSKEIVADLNAMKASFNPDSISTLSQAAGAAAVRDDAYMHENTAKVMRTRDHAYMAFVNLGFDVMKSHTNFLFVSPPNISASEYTAKLREDGILVRYYNAPRIDRYVRITIGTDEQMDKVLSCTQKILQKSECYSPVLLSMRQAAEESA